MPEVPLLPGASTHFFRCHLILSSSSCAGWGRWDPITGRLFTAPLLQSWSPGLGHPPSHSHQAQASKPKGMTLILCSDISLLHNSSTEMDHLWLSRAFKKAAMPLAFCTLLPHRRVGRRATTLIPFAQTQATALLAAPHPTKIVRASGLPVSGC